MKTTIQKWGNSLAIRIPKSLVEQQFFLAGEEVDVSVKKGVIVIERLEKSEYYLDELVAKITPENRHEAIDWGGPVGKEIW